MASSRANAAQLFLVNPLLERRIADPQRSRRIARIEQLFGMQADTSRKIQLYSYQMDK
jgi:hypothetical protein